MNTAHEAYLETVTTTHSGELVLNETAGSMFPRPDYSTTRIQISPLNYGYTVSIGCQDFAFETAERMLAHLTNYLKDPDAAAKNWFDDKLLP